MNRSWKNNSNNSPGFVYYNVSNPNQSQPSDTADFLSFGNNSTPCKSPNFKRFSPSHYSSPQKYNKRSPKNFNIRNSYRYSEGGQYNNSYNSPNNSYNSYGNSYNNSFNNSYNRRSEQQVRNKKNFNKYKLNNANKSGTRKDISKFYDHTCLKDPWTELVKNLERQQKIEAEIDAIDPSKQEKSEAKEEKDEESSSESNDQDSDSESKSSSSTPEEETT